MKGPDSMNAADLFIDIGQSSLHAVSGNDAFAFPLERGENGRLTDLCRERLTLSLRGFLSARGRPANRNALCAIGARGVSMRRLSLPASSDEELQRVLRLQIEGEFPLSPDELAWGSRPAGPPKASTNGNPARQDLLVVAVKKEVLEEYAGVLAACGVVPSFTLGALLRAEAHPPFPGRCAVLDIGRTHSELVCFENGVPASIRILPWGGESITKSIQEKLGVSHDEAEKLKMISGQPSAPLANQGQALAGATESALGGLAAILKTTSLGEKLYLTGKSARGPGMAASLTGFFGGAVSCESLEQLPGAGSSATVTALKKTAGGNGASPPLVLALNGGQATVKLGRPAVWKWVAGAVLLALGALLFPFAEAVVFKPFLERKLAAMEADRGRLATIDQELDFLKFLKQNQPPYLDVIYLLAQSSPQGTRLEELSMGHRREINIRLKLANAQQLTEFRSKLIDSGWFANVVVEEQAPSPDRRYEVRMTAELKPAETRKPLPAVPPGRKTEHQLAGEQPPFNAPPPEPMAMPASQPMGMPAEAAPGPPPGGQNDTPPPPPTRRRVRQPTTPEP